MYQGVDRLISHFLAVAAEGNISSAARTLNMTQPALTRNIRLLEEHLGVQLFRRHSSGVSLTRSGQFLARRARFMQVEFDHARAEISAFKDGWHSEITIGANPAWALIYVPEIVAAFRKQLSGVRINIVSELPRPLLTQLLDGELDVVFSGLGLTDTAEVVSEPLVEMERVVIAGAHHPLACESRTSPQRLLEFPWVVQSGDELATTRLHDYFSSHGCAPPKIDMTCNAMSELLAILRATDSLATTPLPFTRHSIAEGVAIVPIQGSLWRYQTGVIYRREPSPSRVLQAFLACVRNHFPERAAGSAHSSR